MRTGARLLLFPLAASLILYGYALAVSGGESTVFTASFAGAATVLLLWTVGVFLQSRERGRTLEMEVLLKKPHWVQMLTQIALLVYWGWFVRSVVAFAPFVIAQIVFAYGVESLITWSRRHRYRLGFGPFPVVFSITFFLWFRFDWFYWQFAMVGLVFFAKEFIHWTRDGRSRHIFNPSSFALAVAAVLLIATGSSDITFGLEIAQTLFNPPFIFPVIFLVSIPVQLLFGVATMSVAAVVSGYAFVLAFHAVTGTYYFYDAYIPIAVFLGMHLLFTDPATSPRSEQGRVLYGVMYGLGVIAMAGLLSAIGAPTFWDKLLPVLFLNVAVRGIDNLVESGKLRLPSLPGFGGLSPAQHRYAVVGLWVLIFTGMSVFGGVDDDHPGQYLPFWAETCQAGNERACDHLAVMQQNYCDRGSGWACNEFGVFLAVQDGDVAGAAREFELACSLESPEGCENLRRVQEGGGGTLARGQPTVAELPIVLRGSKGPVTERDPAALYAMACEQGWPGACEVASAS